MQAHSLSNRLSLAIDRQAGGSYAVRVDYGSQRARLDDSDGSEGYTVRIDYSLPGGAEPIRFTATNFDILFNVNRPPTGFELLLNGPEEEAPAFSGEEAGRLPPIPCGGGGKHPSGRRRAACRKAGAMAEGRSFRL